jgi:FMN-dependent NADH-azoreductase
MKKLLHIIATPREEESRTLQIANAFFESFTPAHSDWIIEELNLFKEVLPPLTMKRVDGKYQLLAGKDLYGELKEGWEEIILHIERFLSASLYVISTPMWNFTIPYLLKHYIDIIVQPRYLFRYTKSGVEGLAKEKKMLVLASYGGTYTTPQTKKENFHESYLREIFGFVGITDIDFIVAQGVDMGKEQEKKSVAEAMASAKELALKLTDSFRI